MSRNSNVRKDKLLGMSHGTAANRLRKMILFSLLERFNLNICFKCGESIAISEELSIEHKISWERAIDPKAEFFDLGNIAFSHLVCNRPDCELVGAKRRRIGPEGTAWCIGHQAFLPIEKFRSLDRRWNGLSERCRECQKINWAKYKKK